MADFAANLMTEPPIKVGYTGGGTASADGLAEPPIKYGYTGGGNASALNMAEPPFKRGTHGGGTVAASVLAMPAVEPADNIGGGTVLAAQLYFGDAQVVNRVFDSVANKFITWPSIIPDRAGARYPGPGQFGVTTSDYVLLSY